MADLVAADVTVTVDERTIVGKKRRNRVTITFGDGAKTYPAGGVPLPAFGSFGHIRNLDYLTIFDVDDASGIMWKYDRTNNKLRGYRQGVRTGSTAAADSTSGALLENMAAAETTLRGMGTAIDVDIDLGLLRELTSAGNPPAAQTLQAEATGW
jgi:hypothetical protein